MKKTLPFLLLILLAQFALAQKEIELAYRLNQGQQFKLHIKNNQNISMNMEGQTMILQQQMNMEQGIDVKSIENKNLDLSLTYQSIWFKQNAMGMEIVYDSKQPDTANPVIKQMHQNLGKMIGSPMSIVIDDRGNPIRVDKGVSSSKAANLAGFESGMMVIYPEKPVKKGDSWKTRLQPDPTSDFVIESTYVLDELDNKKAHISFSGTITGTKIMGEHANISGVISGKTKVDLLTGWVLEASVNQKLEMEMEQQGMKLPMQMSSFIELVSE